MMHTMERYFSKYEDATLTDAIAEALLRTVKDAVVEVLRDPEDYRNRAAIMWASSLSHNDLTECGTEKDFACHKLEHELSGLFGVTHGAGLAAIWGSWARYVMDRHLSRFVKFAKNVMSVEAPDASEVSAKAVALKGIEATERFFQAIGMPVSIPELIGRQATDEEILEMVRKCSRDGKMNIGAMEVLKPADMEAVYRLANK
jgi:alcohol dehydrogenase YqhD (iron-dependent ADH family)